MFESTVEPPLRSTLEVANLHLTATCRCSREVRHKLAKLLVEKSLYFEIIMRWEQHCWSRNRLSPISDCIFLYHILEMIPNLVYQALDGHLIEVTTMGELSLGRPRSGRGSLIGVAAV